MELVSSFLKAGHSGASALTGTWGADGEWSIPSRAQPGTSLLPKRSRETPGAIELLQAKNLRCECLAKTDRKPGRGGGGCLASGKGDVP